MQALNCRTKTLKNKFEIIQTEEYSSQITSPQTKTENQLQGQGGETSFLSAE